MGSQWGATGAQGRMSTRFQRQHMLEGGLSSYSREVRSASCGPPSDRTWLYSPSGPGAPTWVALKPSLGWTFPICTGTKAVNQSATQSTNDSEAAFSDKITKKITKTNKR